MEEILASIRRIIEDSDPGHGVKPVANDHHVAAPPAQAERLPQEERSQPVAQPQQQLAQQPVPQQAVQQPVPQPVAQPVPPQQPVRASAGEGTVRPVISQEVKHAGPLAEPSAPPIPAKETAVESVATFAQPARKPAPEQKAQQEAPRPASLIAEQTSRQVAAAFNELSAAVEDSRRRGFEKMAEEMMRPMLKEWLDRNLPPLVERLVREEIRRISEAGEEAA